ncbi:hypothetical protein Tco_1090705 [Tanacetum coccineum]|uniref:Uncharacterized protein n=1 Tax=Tanacetum coccineum TaxID=301880 RepID=A0ABQ5I6V6_9ASTR
MLAPGNYVQWKSRIKRYIDTKPNSELIHHYLKNPPYTYQWAEKTVPIILTGIVNRYLSKVDACPNDMRIGIAIERLNKKSSVKYKFINVNVQFLLQTTTMGQRMEVKGYRDSVKTRPHTANPLGTCCLTTTSLHHLKPLLKTINYSTRSQQATRNRGKAIVNSSAPIYDQEPATVTKDDEMLKEKEIDKLMALISLSFKKFYKPTNNNLRTSSNTSRANQDNSPRINRGTGYDNQRAVNVAGARENVAYHKEKMLLCKQEEARVHLNAEQADWKDESDD